MNHYTLFFGLSALGAIGLVTERQAAACGGCFHPPTQVASDITDERMLLTVSPEQTTLYDQIRYSGNPASFAWVLPIKGTVDVGLSADVLFDTVDELTATQINPPPSTCPGLPADCQNALGGSAAPDAGATGGSGGGNGDNGVTVTKQENVGPYETVQLHATDSGALEAWLAKNSFDIPDNVKPVIAAYVNEGFDFLAMKLLPGSGVQAMRPVRVSMPGASLSLPLRMAAIGTGVSVGITIWVVSDGRYEPQNFPLYHIEDKDLVWDWSTSSSNYTTLRAQNEAKLDGKGWEIESSLSLNQQLITNVILSGGVYYQGGGVSSGPPSDASVDYLPVQGDGPFKRVTQSADEVRAKDITALFKGISSGNVRVTRMRSDIAHAAMTTDFILQASADQSELSNVREVTTGINEQCVVYSDCQVIGTGTPDQANAAAGMPTFGRTSAGRNDTGTMSCAATARPLSQAHVGYATAGGLALATAFVARRRRGKTTRATGGR